MRTLLWEALNRRGSWHGCQNPLGERTIRTIVITGATGQLGRLVVATLLDQDLPAGQIVATGRDLAKVADLADRGVQVRQVDFLDRASLRRAFAGAGQVLLISGSEPGQRIQQQQNAITAVKDAGVGLIAHTSIANADHTSMPLAAEHQATEEALVASGVPFALLRNGWYLENCTDQLGTYVEHGDVSGPARRTVHGGPGGRRATRPSSRTATWALPAASCW
ncbi:MAG TPA: NAD(P)H-binding protein [Arthrobacter sp.]